MPKKITPQTMDELTREAQKSFLDTVVILKNLQIIAYTKAAHAIYFTAIYTCEQGSKSSITLWIHKNDVYIEHKDKVNVRYINASVDIEGIFSVGTYNQLEIDVTKFKITLASAYHSFPLFPYKIAVISNFGDKADKLGYGLQDFLYTLKYGSVYASNVKISNISAIIDAIKNINNKTGFDCICIIRGGGSDSDMENYNNKNLAEAIKNSKIPIILGHKENTFPELTPYVAQECITPTAAANFLNSCFRQLQVDIEKKLLLNKNVLENNQIKNL